MVLQCALIGPEDHPSRPGCLGVSDRRSESSWCRFLSLLYTLCCVGALSLYSPALAALACTRLPRPSQRLPALWPRTQASVHVHNTPVPLGPSLFFRLCILPPAAFLSPHSRRLSPLWSWHPQQASTAQTGRMCAAGSATCASRGQAGQAGREDGKCDISGCHAWMSCPGHIARQPAREITGLPRQTHRQTVHKLDRRRVQQQRLPTSCCSSPVWMSVLGDVHALYLVSCTRYPRRQVSPPVHLVP